MERIDLIQRKTKTQTIAKHITLLDFRMNLIISLLYFKEVLTHFTLYFLWAKTSQTYSTILFSERQDMTGYPIIVLSGSALITFHWSLQYKIATNIRVTEMSIFAIMPGAKTGEKFKNARLQAAAIINLIIVRKTFDIADCQGATVIAIEKQNCAGLPRKFWTMFSNSNSVQLS